MKVFFDSNGSMSLKINIDWKHMRSGTNEQKSSNVVVLAMESWYRLYTRRKIICVSIWQCQSRNVWLGIAMVFCCFNYSCVWHYAVFTRTLLKLVENRMCECGEMEFMNETYSYFRRNLYLLFYSFASILVLTYPCRTLVTLVGLYLDVSSWFFHYTTY